MVKKPAANKDSQKKPKIAKKIAPISPKIIAYLEKAGVPHEVISHKTVYTAYDAAQTLKRKLGEIAKSLLVKADQDYFVVILPADHNLDIKKLQAAIGKQTKKAIKVIKIPGGEVVEQITKTKNQALTAFGGLHNLPVIVDENLAKIKKAIFSAGNANHSIETAVKDFIKAEQAMVAKFGVKRVVKKVKKVAAKPKPAQKAKPKLTVKKATPKKVVKKK
jgi:prolyl-tRNA editing enzyme YbaK/EbsC (Cys-tRNA(Pro) deacylase)